MAAAVDARLHLIHDIPDVLPFWSFEASDVDWDGLRSGWVEEARQRLAEFDAPPTSERVVQINHPAADIVRYAEEHGIDTIVRGTHGRGPIKEILIGSFADKVVQSAQCPVLTVRQPAHDTTD